jgi:predicted nucleotidyltransferase
VIGPAERAQIERALAGVRDALGTDLVGAYLFGSAVLGGFGPRSDLDVMVVSGRRMSQEEKRRLIAHLREASMRPRPLELTVVVRREIRPWRYPPEMDFQYGDWWRAEFERGEVEPWGSRVNPDLASLITMVLAAGSPLAGPPAGDVFDPVPPADYAASLAAGVDGLLAELGTDTRNVVLTLARIWAGIVTGDLRSKDAAADWALPRLPQELRPVLARARAIHPGEEAERWDDLRAATRAFATDLASRIERARHETTTWAGSPGLPRDERLWCSVRMERG